MRLARTFQGRKVDFGALQFIWRFPRNTMVRKHDFEKTFQFVLSTKQEWSRCQKGPEYDTRHKMGPEPEYLGQEPNT